MVTADRDDVSDAHWTSRMRDEVPIAIREDATVPVEQTQLLAPPGRSDILGLCRYRRGIRSLQNCECPSSSDASGARGMSARARPWDASHGSQGSGSHSPLLVVWEPSAGTGEQSPPTAMSMLLRPKDNDVTEPSELPNRPISGDVAARSASQLTILLTAAMAAVDEELKRTERLDTKSRNQITLTATMCGVAQAIAVGLVNGVLADDDTRAAFLVALVAGTAIIALGCLAWGLVRSYRAWDIHMEKALGIGTFDEKMYLGAAKAGNPNVGANLVTAYAEIARVRRENNTARAAAIKRAEFACALTMAWVGIELVLAFAAVILQHA